MRYERGLRSTHQPRVARDKVVDQRTGERRRVPRGGRREPAEHLQPATPRRKAAEDQSVARTVRIAHDEIKRNRCAAECRQLSPA